MANDNPTAEKKLFSINVADRYNNGAGEEKTKFREVAVGFGNRKGGLAFQLPKGVTLSSDAEIVIFPIEKEEK